MNQNKSAFNLAAVLFDLDGTLIDTAPDFLYCLNILRRRNKLPDLLVQEMRHYVSYGSKMIIEEGLKIGADHRNFSETQQEFLELYAKNIYRESRLFPGIEDSLSYLAKHDIPWGIVTNKPARFTLSIMSHIDLPYPPKCVVSGDTTQNPKPQPDPLFFAANALNVTPATCLFMGDSPVDLIAGNRAGMKTVLAQYGYIDPLQNTSDWQTDHYVATPPAILPLLRNLIAGTK